MGGDAERQPGLADGLEVGVGEILLAEMQVFCAGDDGRAPIVVYHEFCRRALGDLQRVGDDLQGLGVVEVLGAQLDRADAKPAQALDPGEAVDDRIKSDQDTACQNGVPTTGVEGEAKSRAFISPASYAVRPASTPRRKALAMATGSAAFAIAVLSSTAS